jgi:hypothetical protein
MSGLFNDAVGLPHSIAPNKRMVYEYINGKNVKGSGRGLM